MHSVCGLTNSRPRNKESPERGRGSVPDQVPLDSRLHLIIYFFNLTLVNGGMLTQTYVSNGIKPGFKENT